VRDAIRVDRAEEMLLDDIGLAFLDSMEAIRDVKPVLDVVRRRDNEAQLCRVLEPPPDQRGRFDCARALSETGRGETAELGIGRETGGDRSFVLRRDGVDQPTPERRCHGAKLMPNGIGVAASPTASVPSR